MAIYKKKNNYYIDYYANGRRIREKIGASKTLADNVLRKRKLAIAENRFLDIKKQNKIKFEELADMYLELHSKPHKRSHKSDISNTRRLKEFFGGKHLYEITPLLVEKFKTERIKKVSHVSTNRQTALLKHMLTKAVEWGKISDNQIAKVKLYKESNGRLRYLDKEEIEKLLRNCRGNLKPIIIIALNTGMRRGEIFNLKWQDIDFKNGIINIYITKNGEKKTIPMNEMVKTAFIRVRKHPESAYVFSNEKGEPTKDIRKSFFTACRKSGILNFRFHDLRHTFASHLVMAGVDLNTVRELMGHKKIEMTLRYSHLSPDHKKRAVDILQKRMDTIWTPSPVLAKEHKKIVSVTPSYIST